MHSNIMFNIGNLNDIIYKAGVSVCIYVYFAFLITQSFILYIKGRGWSRFLLFIDFESLS